MWSFSSGIEGGLGGDGKTPVSRRRIWEDFGSPPASPELHFSRLSRISAMQLTQSPPLPSVISSDSPFETNLHPKMTSKSFENQIKIDKTSIIHACLALPLVSHDFFLTFSFNVQSIEPSKSSKNKWFLYVFAPSPSAYN